MSKNRNYSEFYKKPEEPKADEPVQEAEEVTPEIEEETPVVQEEPKEEKPEVIYRKAIVINAKKVNFREAPNKDAKVLAVLPAGAQVRFIDYGSEWTKIEFDNKQGYMMNQFLKEI